jgi:hypothetical protein
MPEGDNATLLKKNIKSDFLTVRYGVVFPYEDGERIVVSANILRYTNK